MEVIASPQYFHFPLQEWFNGTPTAVWPAADASGKWVPPPTMIAPVIPIANIIAPMILLAAKIVAPTTVTAGRLPE